ncbi:MAG: hypothetical protein ACI936_002940 [Paraglaciecola sp.]|jgi:hypothetical protein
MDKKLNVKNSNVTQLIACILSLSGLFFCVRFFMQVEFNISSQVWFSAQYYEQFIPFYVAILLLLSGVFVFMKYSQANLYLASFGHATSEEIIFNWIGIVDTPLPAYSIAIFLPLSLVALWAAYFNMLKQKPISILEAVVGFVISTLFILLPRFL